MVRFSEGHVMFAVRSAIMALAMGLMTSPAVATGESRPSAANKYEITVCRLDQVTLQPVMCERPRSSGLTSNSSETPSKMLLGESDQHLAEESDLGPVLPPGYHGSFVPIASNASRVPIVSPLRC
jgi:hypothetical protein